MRALILLLIVGFAMPALGRSRKSSKSGLNANDPSTDFSAHFDEEVKYQREHPDNDDGAEAAPKKKKRRSHKKKAASAEAENDAEQVEQP